MDSHKDSPCLRLAPFVFGKCARASPVASGVAGAGGSGGVMRAQIGHPACCVLRLVYTSGEKSKHPNSSNTNLSKSSICAMLAAVFKALRFLAGQVRRDGSAQYLPN